MKGNKAVNKLDVSEKYHVVDHETEEGKQFEPLFLFWPLSYDVQNLINLTIFEDELNVRKLELDLLVVLFKGRVLCEGIKNAYLKLHILLLNVLVETVEELS